MDLSTAAVAGAAAGYAFSVWMPLHSFVSVTVAAAATAVGRRAVHSVLCGALAPRDGEPPTNPEFYAVIACILRSFITGDIDVTGLHVVSLPHVEESTESLFESLMVCLQSLDRETANRAHSLFEFEADYFVAGDAVGEALLAQTCAVVRRHRHTLRRLKVPRLQQYDAPTFAAALAECTAITSLDLTFTRFLFQSWQHLGPTLHTLKLNDLGIGKGTPMFRLLADNMPALRELEFLTPGPPPAQDGFIELVSRLRSLTLNTGSPWDSVTDPGAWPLTLPSLEELVWLAGAGADAVAIALLRRAVALRAVHGSHSSALAAITAGPVAGVSSLGDPRVHAPLSNVQRLTLVAVATDAASLATTLAASPRASVVQLQWSRSALLLSQVLELLPAAALSASVEKGEGAGWSRVRRVRLKMAYFSGAPNIAEAARCVRALFPRARYASWSAFGSLGVLLLPLPDLSFEVISSATSGCLQMSLPCSLQ